MIVHKLVSEFDLKNPHVELWQRERKKSEPTTYDKVEPGEFFPRFSRSVTVRAADKECWYTVRIETGSDSVDLMALHDMWVKGWRFALQGNEISETRTIGGGPSVS